MKYIIFVSILFFTGCTTPETLVETNYHKVNDELDHWKPNIIRYSAEVGIAPSTMRAKYNITKMKCNKEFRKVKYEKVSRYRKTEDTRKVWKRGDYRKNEGFETKEEIKYTNCERLKILDNINFTVSWAGEKFETKRSVLNKLPNKVLEKLIEWRNKEEKDKKNPHIIVYYEGHEIDAVAQSDMLVRLADAAIYESKKN